MSLNDMSAEQIQNELSKLTVDDEARRVELTRVLNQRQHRQFDPAIDASDITDLLQDHQDINNMGPQ